MKKNNTQINLPGIQNIKPELYTLKMCWLEQNKKISFFQIGVENMNRLKNKKKA